MLKLYFLFLQFQMLLEFVSNMHKLCLMRLRFLVDDPSKVCQTSHLTYIRNGEKPRYVIIFSTGTWGTPSLLTSKGGNCVLNAWLSSRWTSEVTFSILIKRKPWRGISLHQRLVSQRKNLVINYVDNVIGIDWLILKTSFYIITVRM